MYGVWAQCTYFMGKPTNVRIDREILDKIDELHSGALSRTMVIDILLQEAVHRWETWLKESGEIEVCKERRAGEYFPITAGNTNWHAYSRKQLDEEARRNAELSKTWP